MERMERTERACEVCGETFAPRRADTRYCGSPCRQEAYRRRRAPADAHDDGGLVMLAPTLADLENSLSFGRQ
jgi:hypothetical protein